MDTVFETQKWNAVCTFGTGEHLQQPWTEYCAVIVHMPYLHSTAHIVRWAMDSSTGHTLQSSRHSTKPCTYITPSGHCTLTQTWKAQWGTVLRTHHTHSSHDIWVAVQSLTVDSLLGGKPKWPSIEIRISHDVMCTIFPRARLESISMTCRVYGASLFTKKSMQSWSHCTCMWVCILVP